MNRQIVLFLVVLLVVLPPVGAGAALAAVHILAEVPGVPPAVSGVADQIGDKSLAYWFVTLAGVAIGSWTWILKWLINQLAEHRKAATDTTDKLIGYLKTDRDEMIKALKDVAGAIDKLPKA